MRQNNSQENREDEIKPGDTDPFRVKENGKMYCKVLEGNKFQTWLKLKTITQAVVSKYSIIDRRATGTTLSARIKTSLVPGGIAIRPMTLVHNLLFSSWDVRSMRRGK